MLTIRSATPTDFEKIWPIFHEIVSAGETYTYPSDTSKEQGFQLWITLPRQTFVAEEDGEILGTYFIKTNQSGGGDHVCNCGYMALRLLLPRLSWNLSPAVLNHAWVVFFLVTWGIAAFALRLWVPTGQERGLLQIGFFASYILLFFFGCAAAQARLLENIDKKLALPWGWISLLTIPSLFAYAILSGALKGVPFHVNGGWTMPAFAYAMWEPFVACGIMLMLLWRFRVSTQPWAFWKKLAPLCYAAFIVHAPVVVGLGVLSQAWKDYSIAMFILVGCTSLIMSFGVAALLIRLPGATKIL
nr:hypothetical protein [uncultured Undibacterium sp.]